MKKRWLESDKERLVDSEKWRKGEGDREREEVVIMKDAEWSNGQKRQKE